MNYFSLKHEYPNSGYIDGDVTFVPPLPDYYQVGAPYDLANRSISVKMDKAVKKLKVDFFLTTSGAFFASEPLAALLLQHQPDLQTYSAETTYFGGKATEKQYRLVHAARRVPCFDYEHSEYAGKALTLQRLARGEDPQTILVKGIQAIVIDEKNSGGANFFFLSNVLYIDPFVSESLASAIREQGLVVHLA